MQDIAFAPGFIGNAAVVRILGHAIEQPVAAYVLTGVPHLGKRRLAEAFVRALLGVAPDGMWRNHPDVFVLEAEEGKKQISVEQVRDLKERVSMRPMHALRCVAYVPSADMLNESGTNALLKVVEEPPAGAVFVLVAEDAGRIPATLKSRCVMLPMNPVPRREIVEALKARGMAEGFADKIAMSARGRVGLALEPEAGDMLGKGFAREMLKGQLGRRLKLIEDLTKACDADESAQQAWRNALQTAMAETGVLLREDPAAGILGIGLTAALRAVGSSIAPRIILEAIAIRMDGQVNDEMRKLLPKQVSRGVLELFI